jgi:flagellar biosynthetic protein FliO
MGVPGSDLPDLGGSIALSFVSLALVCFVAFFVLRWLGRRGVGRSDDYVRVLGRRFLEPRRSIYLIETGGRCFLVGVADGPISLLAEIDKATLPAPMAGGNKSSSSFSEALNRVLRRRGR